MQSLGYWVCQDRIWRIPMWRLLLVVYDYLPFMILPVYNAVMELNEDVIEAARDLGAPLSAVLTKIMIPLTMPGIISGITMVFVPSLTRSLFRIFLEVARSC